MSDSRPTSASGFDLFVYTRVTTLPTPNRRVHSYGHMHFAVNDCMGKLQFHFPSTLVTCLSSDHLRSVHLCKVLAITAISSETIKFFTQLEIILMIEDLNRLS